MSSHALLIPTPLETPRAGPSPEDMAVEGWGQLCGGPQGGPRAVGPAESLLSVRTGLTSDSGRAERHRPEPVPTYHVTCGTPSPL